MKLFVSGKGKFAQRELTPTMKRVKEFLDKSKDGELFEAQQIEVALGLGHYYLAHIPYTLPEYTYLVRNRRRFWGKPRTINQLKKETAK